MHAKHWCTGLTALALLAMSGTRATALTLVKDGKATSAIVIAQPAAEAVKIGAGELQYHLEKMSGVKVPIVSSEQARADAGTALILVGRSPRTDALKIDASGLAAEGYMIRTVGNALVLMGDDAKDPKAALGGNLEDFHGTLFAVYGFLQDKLGCQWIWPGATGEFIPRRATVEVGAVNVVGEPALKRRHMRLVMNRPVGPSAKLLGEAPLAQLREDEAIWYRRMRMGRSIPTPRGHSFTDWWEKYKDTNPEVFALLPNGKRGPSDAGRPSFVKMDVANPKFWDLQLKLFKEMRAKNPSRHDLSCCENDGSSGFCTCDLCKAWDLTVDKLAPDVLNNLDDNLVNRLTPGKDGGIPTCLSARYAKWYNEMARRVREVDPEGYVTGYAYTRFRDVPLGVTLEPNMVMGYIGFNGYPRTPAQRALDRRDYLGWAQPGVKLYIRPNAPHYTGDGHPYNVARQIAEDLKFCIQHGTFMTDYDSMNGYWAAWGPTFYVLPRMMWEGGDADIEKLLDEWYNAFGPAERQIRKYYDFWEQYMIWVKAAPTGAGRQGVDGIYPPEVIAEARQLLVGAMEAAANADDGVKAKIQNVEMCLRNTELTAKAVKLAREPRDVAALKVALKELAAYRATMAPRNVVNVYKMTDGEMNRGGYWKGARLPWDLIADVKATAGPLLID